MLDKYETQINTELECVLSQLQGTEGAHRAELHTQIARNYWELAYLGLAQGAVLEHTLEQAQENIQQAMTFQATPELALLQGRIALNNIELRALLCRFSKHWRWVWINSMFCLI